MARHQALGRRRTRDPHLAVPGFLSRGAVQYSSVRRFLVPKHNRTSGGCEQFGQSSFHKSAVDWLPSRLSLRLPLFLIIFYKGGATLFSRSKTLNIDNRRIVYWQKSIVSFPLLHQGFCLPPYSPYNNGLSLSWGSFGAIQAAVYHYYYRYS